MARGRHRRKQVRVFFLVYFSLLMLGGGFFSSWADWLELWLWVGLVSFLALAPVLFLVVWYLVVTRAMPCTRKACCRRAVTSYWLAMVDRRFR